jgi:hypothetical protein
MFVQNSYPTSKWGRKLKFGRLVEGPPKPKEKIRSPENFAPGGPKWDTESAFVCLSKKANPLLDEVES